MGRLFALVCHLNVKDFRKLFSKKCFVWHKPTRVESDYTNVCCFFKFAGKKFILRIFFVSIKMQKKNVVIKTKKQRSWKQYNVGVGNFSSGFSFICPCYDFVSDFASIFQTKLSGRLLHAIIRCSNHWYAIGGFIFFFDNCKPWQSLLKLNSGNEYSMVS